MALSDYLRGEVVEDFGDGLISRREALRRLCLLGLTLSSASALLAACSDGTDDASPDDPAGTSTTAGGAAASTITFAGPSGSVQAAFAAPANPKATVLVSTRTAA